MSTVIEHSRLENLRQRKRNMQSAAVRPQKLDGVFSPQLDAFDFKPDLKPPELSFSSQGGRLPADDSPLLPD